MTLNGFRSILFADGGSTVYDNSIPFVVTLPAGCIPGDQLYIYTFLRSATGSPAFSTPPAPAGWTKGTPAGSTYGPAGPTIIGQICGYYKTATALDISTGTVTFTPDALGHSDGLYAWASISYGNPVNSPAFAKFTGSAAVPHGTGTIPNVDPAQQRLVEAYTFTVGGTAFTGGPPPAGSFAPVPAFAAGVTPRGSSGPWRLDDGSGGGVYTALYIVDEPIMQPGAIASRPTSWDEAGNLAALIFSGSGFAVCDIYKQEMPLDSPGTSSGPGFGFGGRFAP